MFRRRSWFSLVFRTVGLLRKAERLYGSDRDFNAVVTQWRRIRKSDLEGKLRPKIVAVVFMGATASNANFILKRNETHKTLTPMTYLQYLSIRNIGNRREDKQLDEQLLHVTV